MSKGKRKRHEWGFQANTPDGDLLYCPLCNRWSLDGGKTTFPMSHAGWLHGVGIGRFTGGNAS